MLMLRSTYLNRVGELIDDRDRLQSQLNKLRSQISAEENAAEVVIDFDQLNPFSVERHTTDGQRCTIIGYFNCEGKREQWYLYCSLEQHNKLIDQYKAYMWKVASKPIKGKKDV